MKKIEVQDASVPAPGFGTWQLKGSECVKAVETALNVGFRHVDTAQIYENEGRVGAGIARSDVDRDNVFLTTKVWRDRLASRKLKHSVDASLNRLGTDYVDLLLIHWPFMELQLESALEKMEELVEENKVRHIGISNFNTVQIDEAQRNSGVKLLTNQVEYHPFLSQKPVLERCRDHGMMLTAYSPLARGDVMDSKVIREIAGKYGKTAAQVALRWHLQQEMVCPIPKASKEEHMRQNLDVFDFELSGDEMERIQGLACGDRKVDPSFAPEWD